MCTAGLHKFYIFIRYRRAVVDDHVMVACPRIMKPVCGSDSFTYDNDCGISFPPSGVGIRNSHAGCIPRCSETLRSTNHKYL
uniref:Kazal-like domain-containing protein n=1 Tax=Malurus cyaneus samueli TaxID=2593467 RepID=A0A8C5UCX2_9PASS